MKESTIIEMKNKIEALGNVMQQLIYEIEHLKTIAIGTNQVVKKLPGYKAALEVVKQEFEESTKDPQDEKVNDMFGERDV